MEIDPLLLTRLRALAAKQRNRLKHTFLKFWSKRRRERHNRRRGITFFRLESMDPVE